MPFISNEDILHTQCEVIVVPADPKDEGDTNSIVNRLANILPLGYTERYLRWGILLENSAENEKITNCSFLYYWTDPGHRKATWIITVAPPKTTRELIAVWDKIVGQLNRMDAQSVAVGSITSVIPWELQMNVLCRMEETRFTDGTFEIHPPDLTEEEEEAEDMFVANAETNAMKTVCV